MDGGAWTPLKPRQDRQKAEPNNANYAPFNFRAANVWSGWFLAKWAVSVVEMLLPGGPVSICLTFHVLFCHPLSFVHVVSFSNMCPALAGSGIPPTAVFRPSPPFFSVIFCVLISVFVFFLLTPLTRHAFYDGHARSNTQMLREFLAFSLVDAPPPAHHPVGTS